MKIFFGNINSNVTFYKEMILSKIWKFLIFIILSLKDFEEIVKNLKLLNI